MSAKSYYIEVINSLLSDHYAHCITINEKAPQHAIKRLEMYHKPI
jgi:hypothetical protein